MKLSIIVPAYNVSQWIIRCLNSLIKQDIDYSQYEIIIVNDGSADDTLTVTEKFIFDNPSYTIKLINQANLGLAGARNTGIRQAAGEYLLFADPDDFIVSNVLAEMLDFAISGKLEIAMFSQRLIYMNAKIDIHRPPNESSGIISGFELFHCRPGDSACKYLIKSDFLISNDLYFFEQARFLEDAEWSTRLFSKAKKCAYKNVLFYNYEFREGSLITSNVAFSDKALRGYIASALNLLSFKNSRCEGNNEKKFINQGIIKFTLLPISLLAAKKNYKDLSTTVQYLKEAKLEKLDTRGVKGFRKRHGILYNLSPSLLWFYLLTKTGWNSLKYKLAK